MPIAEDSKLFIKIKEELLDKEAQTSEQLLKMEKFGYIVDLMDIIPPKRRSTGGKNAQSCDKTPALRQSLTTLMNAEEPTTVE
jgi:hypothetical protein